jgi:hypothetical protein
MNQRLLSVPILIYHQTLASTTPYFPTKQDIEKAYGVDGIKLDGYVFCRFATATFQFRT